jgi:translocation and assembly module TamB
MAGNQGPRWLRRSLACLIGVVALLAIVASAGLVMLHSLDQPWLKVRLQALARRAGGVEIDYRAVRFELLSGAEIEGLCVQSPAEVRAFAPELIRVGRVSAHWSLRPLRLGRAPVLERVVLSDVALSIVVDEQGRTSLDALAGSGSSSAPGPSLPLSRMASKWLGSSPPVDRLEVDHITLALVRTVHAELFDRTELRGVSIALAMSALQPSARGFRLNAELGSPANPLELALSRAQPGVQTRTARAKLFITVEASASALHAIVDLRMLEQSFVARVSADHWLHAEAKLRFDPSAGRTEITLDHTEAGDRAASVIATIEVSDRGTSTLRRARGELDLARLSRWLPDGLVPATAERARLRFEVDSLALAPVVQLDALGVVRIDAELANVAVRAPTSQLDVRDATLSLYAQPAEGGALASHGALTLDGAQVVVGPDRLTAERLACAFDGSARADGTLDGHASLRFARVEHAGSMQAAARYGYVELRAAELHVATDAPRALRGDLALALSLAALDVRPHAGPVARTVVDALELSAHALLEGHAPYAADIAARSSRLQVSGRDGNLLANAPAHFEGRARAVEPDLVHPAASRGVIHAALELGELQASLDATKHADAIDYALAASARSLQAVRPFLPPALRDEAAWDRMAVALRSNGRLEHLSTANPALRERTEVELERPSFENVGARSLVLRLASQGTPLQQKADLDLRAQALTFDGGTPSDDHVTLSANLDRTRPSFDWQFASEGRALSKLSGSLSFDASRRAVAYAFSGKLRGLGPLAHFAAKLQGLSAIDLSQLEVELSAHGALLGVVSSVARDGSLTLEPNVLRSASVEGATDLRLAHVRWTKGDTAIVAPDFRWHGDLHNSGERRILDSRFEVGTLHLDLGSHNIDLNGVSDTANVAITGTLADPDIELTHRIAVRAVEQTLLPAYPLGDLVFEVSAERNPDGVVHISELNFANGSGGTTLAVSGNVDLADGRRTLSVNASLAQDLARLSTIPERLKGRGKLAIEANVTSPDFAHYHVRASVKGEDVSVTLARAGFELEAANGEVPITLSLELRGKGVVLERSQNRNPYSMLRFADQLPLLRRSGFLSIARLKTPFVSIAPLVGNLEIEQNLVSLRQFEMGVRGGSITGQCGLAWEGPKSTLELHVRASGVRSSHGEPFDGNIAVAISAADRTIDGRAEILRIGERHLLDLLDLQDPQQVDPALNRIRTALNFGYPDSMRVVFDHGFASAHLELGGLARLVSISELRGIPMGPIVDRMLAQMLDGSDLKETP